MDFTAKLNFVNVHWKSQNTLRVCVPVSDNTARSSLRSAQRGDLFVPRTRTKLGTRSFRVAAPTVWNSLPTELRSTSVSHDTFKSRLKSHFYADAYLHQVWERSRLRQQWHWHIDTLTGCDSNDNSWQQHVCFRTPTLSYLSRHIVPHVSARHLRSSITPSLCKPTTRTCFTDRTFWYTAPTVWNSLIIATSWTHLNLN